MSSSFPLSTTAMALAALVAGVLVTFQAGSNAALGRALGHPLWASVASLLVSILVVLPVVLAMRAPAPAIAQAAAQLPWWAWLGGVGGAIYVTAALLLTPRLGATNFIVCTIAAQMLASLLIDHFGLVRLPVREANLGRIAGVALIFIGMLVVQWFTPPAPAAAPPDASPLVRHQNTGSSGSV